MRSSDESEEIETEEEPINYVSDLNSEFWKKEESTIDLQNVSFLRPSVDRQQESIEKSAFNLDTSIPQKTLNQSFLEK